MTDERPHRWFKHRRWSSLAAACAAVVAVFVAATATATVMKYLDLGDLVDQSDVIVRGTVKEMEQVTDERGTFRHTTIEVDTAYMGEPGETVTLEQWRGTISGDKVRGTDQEVTRRVPGDASFEQGEEVVVFLREGHSKYDRDDVLYLTGLAQSKWTVHREDAGATVKRDLSKLAIVSNDGGDKMDLKKISNEQRDLASFEAELRALVYANQGDDGSDAAKGGQ